ncbi:hypothetical protein ASE75_03595 [Sphingomonas sp. Leaf17]|uniref:hypothetical protein n=1 Tax=Sphingomonas sp. Leaf17 TaxID=1735683 RepID=UPI0006F43A54|nr:hypothetical protein [Sphingomonas sp. Leaf17]KQM67967.1 hypothetical protein ASE75_03595 [Sphingomonas sp. Leaf17]
MKTPHIAARPDAVLKTDAAGMVKTGVAGPGRYRLVASLKEPGPVYLPGGVAQPAHRITTTSYVSP